MTPNARFWIYWNDDFAKITLKHGQVLEICSGGRTDEGWETIDKIFEHHGLWISQYICHDGVDCDGRLTRNYYDEVALADLPKSHERDFVDSEYGKVLRFPVPWKRVSANQRDEYAERMNY